MTENAVVVGGGIVGASAAYHLARAGHEPLVVDRGDEGRATDAGAGIVSPATSSRTGSTAWFRFATAAAEHYPDLAAALGETVDGPVGYDRPGLLAVALDDAEAGLLADDLERIRERQDRLDAPRAGSVAELDPDEAGERLPPLEGVERAFRYEDAARVNGRRFTEALTEAAVADGATVRETSAEQLLVADGAIEGVATSDRRLDAESVVVAGGAWSAEWTDALGVEIPVEPQRGQLAHLETGRETADWPMVAGYRDHYLVPRPDGTVLAGATREDDTGFEPRTTADGVRTVLEEALRVAPGLADATVKAVRVGLRPVTPDGLPLVGPVPDVEGAYLATGHGPTGLTLGPFSGKVVADLVAGEDVAVDLAPFDPGRF